MLQRSWRGRVPRRRKAGHPSGPPRPRRDVPPRNGSRMRERRRRANRTGLVPIAVRPTLIHLDLVPCRNAPWMFPGGAKLPVPGLQAALQRDCEARSGLKPRIRPAWGHFGDCQSRIGAVASFTMRFGAKTRLSGSSGRWGGGRQAPLTKVPQTGSPVLGYSCIRHRSAAACHRPGTGPARSRGGWSR